jgi:ATP-dependent helicase IRC3
MLEKKEKATVEDALQRNPTVHNVPEITSVTYKDYDDPLSWQYQADKENHIFRISSLSWVHLHGSYILECMGRGTIKIEPLNDAGKLQKYRSPDWGLSYL